MAYIRGASPELVETARQMRQAMTPAEQALWEALRERRLGGLRFRTQHPVGQFILDFYCPAYRLAVEVDGDIHERQTEQDGARTAQLEAYGCRVVRFTNEEVLTNLVAVQQAILAAASQTAQAPRPPK